MAKGSLSEIWADYLSSRAKQALTEKQLSDVHRGLMELREFSNGLTIENLPLRMYHFWAGYNLIGQHFEVNLVRKEKPDGDQS